MLKKIKNKVTKSKLIKWIYDMLRYAEIGKIIPGYATRYMGEIQSVIIIFTLLFGIDLTEYKSLFVLGCLGVFMSLILIGYIYKHSGLQKVEEYVINEKSPVQNEILTTIREIKKDIKELKKR